jgi:hypothetical protein
MIIQMGKKVLVNVYVKREVYDRIEVTRGENSRSTYISKIIDEVLS